MERLTEPAGARLGEAMQKPPLTLYGGPENCTVQSQKDTPP
jgi:hypothetical protein